MGVVRLMTEQRGEYGRWGIKKTSHSLERNVSSLIFTTLISWIEQLGQTDET